MPARLLIHAQAGTSAGKVAGARWRLLLRRLGALAAGELRQRPPAPVGVRIDDLQGRQWFMHDDVRPLIEVPLPAGTYHVSVRRGERRWRYTVTLEQGAVFDLHLHPASEGS